MPAPAVLYPSPRDTRKSELAIPQRQPAQIERSYPTPGLIIPSGKKAGYLSWDVVGKFCHVISTHCSTSRFPPMQSFPNTSKLKKVSVSEPIPVIAPHGPQHNCSSVSVRTTIGATQNSDMSSSGSYSEHFFAPALTSPQARVTEILANDQNGSVLQNPHRFCLRIDIVVNLSADRRVAEAVTSILQGAGLRQHSRHSWGTNDCNIEEITDTLSDVFLELQAMDDQAKQWIETFHMSTFSDSQSGKIGMTPMPPHAASDHGTAFWPLAPEGDRTAHGQA